MRESVLEAKRVKSEMQAGQSEDRIPLFAPNSTVLRSNPNQPNAATRGGGDVANHRLVFPWFPPCSIASCLSAAPVEDNRGHLRFGAKRSVDQFPPVGEIVPDDVAVEVAAGGEEDSPGGRLGESEREPYVLLALGPTG